MDVAEIRKALVPAVTMAAGAVLAWFGIDDPDLATNLAVTLVGLGVAITGGVWAVPNKPSE